MSMEEWKNKVMKSTEGMAKAQPDASVLEGIHRQIAEERAQKRTIPQAQWLSVAAVLLVIVVVNFYFLAQKLYQKTDRVEQVEQLYGGGSSFYNLYEQ